MGVCGVAPEGSGGGTVVQQAPRSWRTSLSGSPGWRRVAAEAYLLKDRGRNPRPASSRSASQGCRPPLVSSRTCSRSTQTRSRCRRRGDAPVQGHPRRLVVDAGERHPLVGDLDRGTQAFGVHLDAVAGQGLGQERPRPVGQAPVVGDLGVGGALDREAAAVLGLDLGAAQAVLDVEPAARLPAAAASLDVRAGGREVRGVEVGAAVVRRTPGTRRRARPRRGRARPPCPGRPRQARGTCGPAGSWPRRWRRPRRGRPCGDHRGPGGQRASSNPVVGSGVVPEPVPARPRPLRAARTRRARRSVRRRAWSPAPGRPPRSPRRGARSPSGVPRPRPPRRRCSRRGPA